MVGSWYRTNLMRNYKSVISTVALSAGILIAGPCSGDSIAYSSPFRESVDIDSQRYDVSLIVVGKVVKIKPQQHWVRVASETPSSSYPSLMTPEKAKKAQKPNTQRDTYFTDIVVKVHEILYRPGWVTTGPSLTLRMYNHGSGPKGHFNNDQEDKVVFQKGESVILFLKADKFPAWLGPVKKSAYPKQSGPSPWNLTRGVFSKLTEVEPGVFLQGGDPKDGGGTRYALGEITAKLKEDLWDYTKKGMKE